MLPVTQQELFQKQGWYSCSHNFELKYIKVGQVLAVIWANKLPSCPPDWSELPQVCSAPIPAGIRVSCSLSSKYTCSGHQEREEPGRARAAACCKKVGPCKWTAFCHFCPGDDKSLKFSPAPHQVPSLSGGEVADLRIV